VRTSQNWVEELGPIKERLIMKTETSPNGRRLEVVHMCDVVATEVQWLCEPYIPLGRITLLDGDPESGKTYVALAFSAAVTKGESVNALIPVEGEVGATQEPGNVLYLSAEDNLSDTILPRFTKVGGDVNRFFAASSIITNHDGKEHQSGVKLTDISELEEALKTHKPRLVVFDPFQAFLGAKVDLNRANEVRPVLTALGQLAERNNCAMLIIRHLNKTGQPNAMYRGLGSIDVTAAARSVLLSGKNPYADKGNQFALVHLKCSLGAKGPAIAYSISDDGLSWDGPLELSAEELLNTRMRSPGPRTDAMTFLSEFLADGPKAAAEVLSSARELGLSKKTLDRASDQMCIIKKPSHLSGPWFWRLPPKREPNSLEGVKIAC
jgi:putative DNA primase/helicase